MYQHLEYFAFGETFVEEHGNTNRTPYLFNGKEFKQAMLAGMQELTDQKLSYNNKGQVVAQGCIDPEKMDYGTSLVAYLAGSKEGVTITEAKGDNKTESWQNKNDCN